MSDLGVVDGKVVLGNGRKEVASVVVMQLLRKR
jgi:hypothetical protein